MTTAQASLLSANRGSTAAFTFVELLIVLGVLAIWVMLLLPALANTQPEGRAFQCINNSRQLTRAWQMYADDHNDKLAINSYPGGGTPTYPVWAGGVLDWATSSDNTNTLLLADPRYSALARYCGRDARLFKCPSDQYVSAVQRSRGWRERVRSVSQNVYVGENQPSSFDPAYTVVKKLGELVNPKPSETWVSVDEHPDSINDARIYAPSATQWVDLPANYHDGGAGVAYADGHSEIHRWQASLLNVPIRFVFSAPIVTPSDLDLLWLRFHTPRKPGMN